VENVLTIPQPPDLIPSLELIQTDRTAFRRVSCAGNCYDVLEIHHGQEFLDQESGYGLLFGYPGRIIWPNRIRFEEIWDTQEAKERENEVSDETQKGKCVENEVWEENLAVPEWESHGAPTEKRKVGISIGKIV
jgi:hypothetical protein